MQRINNIRIRQSHPLISPAVLEEEIPLNVQAAEFIAHARSEIADIVHGRDPRLLVIVGPCSVHDPKAVYEYAEKLLPVATGVADRVLIVMRVYFEKPRTTVGWKGYINDPELDNTFKVNTGLRGARRLLSDITSMGLPIATEFLDTILGQYYADFISWGAIGARTVESQIHRQLASGLSMPVGIKNATNGNIEVAIDAIVAASNSHLFPSLTREGAPALLETTGNEDCHLVLRGGNEPNYQNVKLILQQLLARDVRTGILVDCSHGNSQKLPERQVEIAHHILQQRKSDPRILGMMLESHLVAGRQDEPIIYGQSITDACLGWADTEALLGGL